MTMSAPHVSLPWVLIAWAVLFTAAQSQYPPPYQVLPAGSAASYPATLVHMIPFYFSASRSSSGSSGGSAGRVSSSKATGSSYSQSAYSSDAGSAMKGAGEEGEEEPKYYYGGTFEGACVEDGLYYKDDNTFVMCSNGYPSEQPCPIGTKTDGTPSQEPGYYIGDTDLCSVNLVDFRPFAAEAQLNYKTKLYGNDFDHEMDSILMEMDSNSASDSYIPDSSAKLPYPNSDDKPETASGPFELYVRSKKATVKPQYSSTAAYPDDAVSSTQHSYAKNAARTTPKTTSKYAAKEAERETKKPHTSKAQYPSKKDDDEEEKEAYPRKHNGVISAKSDAYNSPQPSASDRYMTTTQKAVTEDAYPTRNPYSAHDQPSSYKPKKPHPSRKPYPTTQAYQTTQRYPTNKPYASSDDNASAKATKDPYSASSDNYSPSEEKQRSRLLGSGSQMHQDSQPYGSQAAQPSPSYQAKKPSEYKGDNDNSTETMSYRHRTDMSGSSVGQKAHLNEGGIVTGYGSTASAAYAGKDSRNDGYSGGDEDRGNGAEPQAKNKAGSQTKSDAGVSHSGVAYPNRNSFPSN